MKLKIGVMQPVALPLEYCDVLVVAKQLGFDGVEIGWQKANQVYDQGTLDMTQRAAIREKARSLNIAIPSVATGFIRKGGMFSSISGERRKEMDALKEGVKLCADLGSQVLLLPFFVNADLNSESNIHSAVECLQELATDAQIHNVMLGVESSLPAQRMIEFLDAVRSPRVGVYWDMGNSVSLGYDPIAELRILGSRISQVHVKEFSGVPTLEKAGYAPGINSVPLGQGHVPLEAILRSLIDVHYEGWLVLETGVFGEGRDAVISSASSALAIVRQTLDTILL